MNVDRSHFVSILDACRERIASSLEYLSQDLSDQDRQKISYGVFHDGLMAAGCVRALGEPDAELRKYLALAANACVTTLRLRGSTVGRIGEIPSGKVTEFIDDSMNNPDTFVSGVYAALIADDQEAMRGLGELSKDSYQTPLVTVPAPLLAYALALHKAIRGDVAKANESVDRLLEQFKGASKKWDVYWVTQAAALRAILRHDGKAFEAAFGDFEQAFKRAHRGKDRWKDPLYFLALPALGLRALAERNG